MTLSGLSLVSFVIASFGISCCIIADIRTDSVAILVITETSKIVIEIQGALIHEVVVLKLGSSLPAHVLASIMHR